MSLEELVLSHVRSDGPVDLANIVEYAKEQWIGAETAGAMIYDEVLGRLNGAIRMGSIEMVSDGDDGVCFALASS